ncbi:MAG: type II toxin-antitoxin system prevent-host-death family antitoxin [Candidatus Omnitrophica bacterium]|nr:type II toxin-antitoxin system prevent-host-death family antitoxin [Candidatus Omnitrophota bacterium]
MISVNTHEAKTRLSELLVKVEKKHETIVICRNGVPIAELSAWHKNKDPLSQSNKLKNVKFYKDPSLPLDEEDWPQASR